MGSKGGEVFSFVNILCLENKNIVLQFVKFFDVNFFFLSNIT